MKIKLLCVEKNNRSVWFKSLEDHFIRINRYASFKFQYVSEVKKYVSEVKKGKIIYTI